MKVPLSLGLLLFVVSCANKQSASSTLTFIDEASARGLDFTYASGTTDKYRLPEIMGGGVALIDSDQDGDLDLYFVQSGSLDERSDVHTNGLFVNDGTGHFTRHDAGDASKHLGYGMGIAVGDVNNDALPDLFVTYVGQNVLLLNQGDNQFKDVSTDADFRLDEWSTGVAFADLDEDGDLDLWVVNYIDWHEVTEAECYQARLGSRDYCEPSRYNAPLQDRVYRNEGDGRFVEVTGPSGVLGTRGNGLGIVVADFNDDGMIDVFVANDTTPNHLWLNQGDFSFKESCAIWNCAVDQHGIARAGMGVATTDFNDDTKPDVMVVNIGGEPDYVFYNEGNYFRDATASVGLHINTQRYTRFGLVVADLNNDSWLDIFEANGAVARLSKPTGGDPYAEPNSIYLGSSERKFTLIPQPESVETSRGTAVGDVNNDGLLDIVVVDRDEPVKLLMNKSTGDGNSLMLDVRDKNGQAALGAKVSLVVGDRTITRVVKRAGSYLSSNDPRVHIGLGEVEEVSNVEIVWMDGTKQAIESVTANQIFSVYTSSQ